MHKLSLYLVFMIPILLCSCKEELEFKLYITDARFDSEIRFQDEQSLGFPSSISVIDNKCFVICTEDQVYLYENGRQTVKIGRKGRAEYEYLLPMIVRTDGIKIYVWCAMRLKFIVYTLDGTPCGEYDYHNAVADFAILDDHICIYNTGRNDRHVIDLYNLKEAKVVHSFGDYPSIEHKTLLKLHSINPMSVSNGMIYFTHKDDLTTYVYDLETYRLKEKHDIRSNIFLVTPKLPTIDDLSYIDSNSSAVLISPRLEGFTLITADGIYEREDGRVIENNRYYSIYSIKGDNTEYKGSLSASSLGDPALFSIHDDKLYYVYHNIENDEDSYSIRTIALD